MTMKATKILLLAAQISRVAVTMVLALCTVVTALGGSLAAAGIGTADPTNTLLLAVVLATLTFGLWGLFDLHST